MDSEAEEAASAEVVPSSFIPAQWKDTAGGRIPDGALVGGRNHDSDLFIGRAVHNGDLLPGKVSPNENVCYVPWGGKEHSKEEYQVLCGTDFEWISSTGGNVPAGAVPGGNTDYGETLYIGRVQHEGTITVGKVHPSHGVCYIPYGGKELGFPDYEILISTSEVEEAVSAPVVPSSFTPAQWVDTVGGRIPDGALVGGRDHDSDLFIGRAAHNGDLLPGKVNPNKKICYVPWGGSEHRKKVYQVLCGTDFEWISSTGGNVPAGAVPGGYTDYGETLYIGRVQHEGTLTVGKVHRSHGVCYIPYEDKELAFPVYEILVSRTGNYGEGESCSICLEEMHSGEIINLICYHPFHRDCINSWLERDYRCPLCRYPDARNKEF